MTRKETLKKKKDKKRKEKYTTCKLANKKKTMLQKINSRKNCTCLSVPHTILLQTCD